MTTLDAVLIVSSAIAFAGALARNVTAVALLASTAFSLALCRFGVQFNFVLWVVIDLIVILCIIRRDMRHRDLGVLALYLPIWVLYIAQPDGWGKIVMVIVSGQLCLMFPTREDRGAIHRLFKRFIGWFADDPNLKMVAA